MLGSHFVCSNLVFITSLEVEIVLERIAKTYVFQREDCQGPRSLATQLDEFKRALGE
jgi:hypothetical protein